MTSSDQAINWEIWLGGLNSSSEVLPDASITTKDRGEGPDQGDSRIRDLLSVANRIFTYPVGNTQAQSDPERHGEGEGGARLIKAALCYRPATKTGRPIIGRIPPALYLPESASARSTPQGTDGAEVDVPDSKSKGRKGGLFICSGHGPWGIALSLGSGKVIREIMLHGDREDAWKDLGLDLAMPL